MTLNELQEYIAAILNGDETLVAGGCVAMPEDQLDVGGELTKQLVTRRGVAILVVTPSVTVLGAGPAEAIPCDIPDLAVVASEMPALNRKRPGAMTALQAAQRVAGLLHRHVGLLDSIRQTADDQTGMLAATATFRVSMTLSSEKPLVANT